MKKDRTQESRSGLQRPPLALQMHALLKCLTWIMLCPPPSSSLHATIPRLFRLEFSIQRFISPVKPRDFPPAASPIGSLPSFPRELLWTIRCCWKSGMPLSKGTRKAFFYMDMMDSQPHAGMKRCMPMEGRREERRGRRREGLPRALRRSSKFSLFFIFQVPAKLGMSAEAECKRSRRENLFHALMPLFLSFLSDSFSPSSSFPVLLSPLLWAQPPVTPKCFSGLP